MKSFVEILEAVGHTDKNTAHTYGECYDRWFAPFRPLPAHILELGTCAFGGGSLLALAEYFQTGTVYGIDQNCGPCRDEVRSHPRIRLIEADVYDPWTPGHADLACGGFDVIIDDASHDAPDQLRAAELYFPLLHAGGLYVCEDTAEHVWTCSRARELAERFQLDIEVLNMNRLRPQGYDNVLARLTHRK